MNNKLVKFFIAIISIIFFSILFFIWIYYFNIFYNKKTNNSAIIKNKIVTVNKSTKTDTNILPTNKGIKGTNLDNKEIKKVIKAIDEKIKNKKIVTINMKKENKDGVNKELIKKIFYLTQDNKSFYFIVKFIDKSFLVFKEWKQIFYIDLWKNNINISIRKDYKEKINTIYDKKDLIKNKVLKWVNKILSNNLVDKGNNNLTNWLSSNLKSFLSWFIWLDSEYKIYWADFIKILNVRTWYRYPLYGSVWLSFNVNRIIYINDIYINESNLWDNLNNQIINKYNNIMFINFTNKELDYFINYFTKRILLEKNINYYNIKRINIVEYKNFILYLLSSKIVYYLDNKKDKNTSKEIKKNIKKDSIMYNIFHSYYRQIRKYTKISPFDIKKIVFINNTMTVLPLQDKSKIKKIINKISNLLIMYTN